MSNFYIVIKNKRVITYRYQMKSGIVIKQPYVSLPEKSNAIHADRLTSKPRCIHRSYYIVFVCIEHAVGVEHATCCLAFRGSRPVIGDPSLLQLLLQFHSRTCYLMHGVSRLLYFPKRNNRMRLAFLPLPQI